MHYLSILKVFEAFYYIWLGTSLLCLFFHLLCYAAVLKILTYYAQYYAHVKMICA